MWRGFAYRVQPYTTLRSYGVTEVLPLRGFDTESSLVETRFIASQTRFCDLRISNAMIQKGRAGTPTRPFQILFQHELSDDNLCRNLVFVVLHGHDVETGSEIVAEAFSAVALDFG